MFINGVIFMLRGKLKKLALILGIILIFTVILTYNYVKDVYDNLSSYKQELIRFHVLANSDSDFDQNLKLKVRDKVLEVVGKKLENSKSIDETRQILENNLDDIQDIAKSEIISNDMSYDVNVYLGNYDFPTKSYGSFTLPAGEYEAVRVVLGEGKGQNWWCVMFPPLCYVDVAHGLTDEKTKEELRNVLSEEEFDMIASGKVTMK